MKKIELNISELDEKVLNTEMDVETFFQDFVNERIRRLRESMIADAIPKLLASKKKIPQTEDEIILLCDLESAKDKIKRHSDNIDTHSSVSVVQS